MAFRVININVPFLKKSLSFPALSYHKNVIDHYENPRNVGSLDKNDSSVGTGLVGAPACGDVMKLQIKVDKDGKIIDAKFKTFGCGSAIASSSLATEWVKGKTGDPEDGSVLLRIVTYLACAISSDDLKDFFEKKKKKKVDDALKLKNSDIAKELALPPVKLHCSMLAEDAIKAALADYKIKQQNKGKETKTA